jgi:hypothetical protein
MGEEKPTNVQHFLLLKLTEPHVMLILLKPVINVARQVAPWLRAAHENFNVEVASILAWCHVEKEALEFLDFLLQLVRSKQMVSEWLVMLCEKGIKDKVIIRLY